MCFFLPESAARTVAAIIAATRRQQALLDPPTGDRSSTRWKPRFILNVRALAALTAYLARVEDIVFADVRWRRSPEGRQLLAEAEELRLRMHASRTAFTGDMLADAAAAELPDLDTDRGPEWAPLSEFLRGLGGLWGSRGIRPGWGGWLPPDYAVAATGWGEMLRTLAVAGGSLPDEEDDTPSPTTTAYSPPLQFVSLRQIEKARESPMDGSPPSVSADDPCLFADVSELFDASSARAPSWSPADPSSSTSSSSSAFASSSTSSSTPGSSSSSHTSKFSPYHSPLSSISASSLPIEASQLPPPITPPRAPEPHFNFDTLPSPPPAPRKRRRSTVDDDGGDSSDSEDIGNAPRVRIGRTSQRKRQRIFVRFNGPEPGDATPYPQPSGASPLGSPFAPGARGPQQGEDAGRRDSTGSWASSARTLSSGEHADADDMDVDAETDSFVTANDGACDEWVVYDPENAPEEPVRDPSPPRAAPRMSSKAAGKRRCWDVLHSVQRFFAIR
ncbi:hypothetical protein TRAPUB_7493 [Trametes pubescens]|uniref:Uncharacterized protein n=1 Tax=Trametes pubescens TaxID=154538 RepID=A0A1M2V3F4_TRAPU|nr:hypothetical protein TRAPUB_7493 [Trametes pubescens]